MFYVYPEEYKKTIPMSFYPDQQIARECQNFQTDRQYAFEVTGLEPGDIYTLEILTVPQVPIVLWNEMGAPKELSVEQEKRLRMQGETLEKQQIVVNKDGCLLIDFRLFAWNIARLHCNAKKRNELGNRIK